jgi:hypothetical protein
MLQYPDEDRPRDAEEISQTGTASANNAQPGRSTAASSRQRIECDVRDGLPTVRGKGRAHYVTGQSGRHMLIVERRLGERIRINSTTEVVILDIAPDVIRIAIETVPEAGERQ